jgi:hypothetical protein
MSGDNDQNKTRSMVDSFIKTLNHMPSQGKLSLVFLRSDHKLWIIFPYFSQKEIARL